MGIDERLRARAKALVEEGRQWDNARSRLSGRENLGERDKLAQNSAGWFASARHLLETLFPDPTSAYAKGAESANTYQALCSLLEMAMVDIDAGVVVHLMDAARAEVFDDFLDQADYYLRGKKTAQAGVIAGVVFEDTVRRACDKIGMPQKGMPLDQLISGLETAGFLLAVKAKRARTAAHVRTKATHAQWDEFEASDVEATIVTTRELIDKLLT